MLSKKELKKLRDGLPRGWREKLVEQSGKSISMVEKVLFGADGKYDAEIIQKAISLRDENRESKKQELEALKAQL